MDAKHVSHYDNAEPGGKDAALNFPSATSELRESGKCLATEQSTASVFHSLRCLERVLKAQAAALGVPDPVGADRSWGKVLPQVKQKFDALPKGDAKAFHEKVYAFIEAFRSPFRNATMHVESVYTGSEAEELFNAAKSLLRLASERLKE